MYPPGDNAPERVTGRQAMRGRRELRVIFGVGTAVLLAVGATAVQAQRADSIKVHGHWTIDVRNRDGSLASHNEIENELVPTGATALNGLLAGNYSAPTWQILLGSAADAGPCVKNLAPPPAPQSSLVITPPATEPSYFPRIDDSNPLTASHPARFQWVFATGSQLAFQLFAFAFSTASTISVGPGQPPGFSVGTPTDWFIPIGQSLLVGSVLFTFNSSAAAPGTYTFPISVTDPTDQNPSNVYTVTIDVAPPDVPDPGQSQPYPCSAVSPGTTIPYELGNAWFPTVGVNVVDAPPSQNLEISGNVTVAYAQAITHVNSIIVVANAALGFSARTLQIPIQVAVGQKIYVKVAFSFS
jgi:hypothetical protein